MIATGSRLPNLVIIGAQKSATSFVQHCLDAHADIHLVRREIAFFEDAMYDPSRIDSLARLLPAHRHGVRWFGIKRPDYLGMPSVPERLARHVPDARLIAVLRHPIDRLVSAYYHFVRYSLLPDEPLNVGVRRALDTEHPPGFSPAESLLSYGDYATALARYDARFPAEQLHVVLHEDVRADPERVYRDTLEFLGLTPQSERPPFAKRQNLGVYDPLRIRFLRFVQRFACRVVPHRNEWGYRFGPVGMGAYFLARQVDKKLLARIRANRPEQLDADLRARLQERYDDEIRRIERRLDRDLSAWRD